MTKKSEMKVLFAPQKQGSYCRFTYPVDRWFNLNIKRSCDSGIYKTSIWKDGIMVRSVENEEPEINRNVQAYFGPNVSDVAAGSFRNLRVSSK